MIFSVSAFVVGLGFLIRSLRAREFSLSFPNTLLGLFWMGAAVVFLPTPFWVPAAILRAFAWLLMSLSAFFLAAVFIDHLRRQIARRSFLNFRFAPKLSLELKEICSALERLLSRRVGALVVLERRQGLEKYMKHGIRIDSEIKAELILSLFQTQSPLHDGAVVISKNRIKAARVVLPLATAFDVPKDLGTRHRSALGLSERTDAIVLVVSEEKGTLGIAYRGNLVRLESPEKFTDLLQLALRGKKIPSSCHPEWSSAQRELHEVRH